MCALIGLPGEIRQERRGQPVPALTGQAGFPVYSTIFGLGGQKVEYQTRRQFRRAG